MVSMFSNRFPSHDTIANTHLRLSISFGKLVGCIFSNTARPPSRNRYLLWLSATLFALNPKLIISSRYDWWLRDVVSAADFADVRNAGHARYNGASASYGVRPAFSIIG